MFTARSAAAKPSAPPSEPPGRSGPARSAKGWENERARAAATQAQKSRSGRDIADDFPAVVNPERRAQAQASYPFFCKAYFPRTFALPWSADHLRAATVIQRAGTTGGLFAYALPRGSGKTSLAEAAVLWSTLFGYRRFAVLIGADESSALEMLESIRGELETNDELLADFPEVCYPIRRLEGIAHRAHGQLFNGQRTHIEWTGKQIVLPTMPGSAASGAIIKGTGITGRIRGMKFKRADGESARPDFCVIDDAQTDESARSPSQCAERIRIINGAVLGLAGPGKKIAAVMPCTVICPGDAADQLLDREKNPQWQGERCKLLNHLPADDALALWEQYAKLRADGLRAGDSGKAATEFYRQHQAAMDAGAAVAWPQRHNADELSALQHAMNLRADLGAAAFAAEYQNQPLALEQNKSDCLTPEQIAAKTTGRGRGEMPAAATKLVAFIDVQKTLLFWAVCAFEPDFTGYVVDYDAFPEQGRERFTARDARKTLSSVLESKSLEETIYQGLDRLTNQLLSRKFTREDGNQQQIEKLLIDANWGDSTDVIYQFCRESPHSAQLVPTHGVYVGAKTARGFQDYRKKPGDETGDHWRRPVGQGKRTVRHGLFDTNFWKSFLHARLAVPAGGRGCLTLFGDDPSEHTLLAEHLTAEAPIPVTAKGKTVTEWQLPPTKPENHWLDCLAGCCVAASMCGISLAERQQPAPRIKRRLKLSEIQKQKDSRPS